MVPRNPWSGRPVPADVIAKSGYAPVIRFLPDTRDVRHVAVLLGPVDSFVLRLESFEHMVGVIFDHIIVNRTSFRAAFGARST